MIAVSFSDPAVYTPGDLLLWPKNSTLDAYELMLTGGIVHPRAAGQRRHDRGRHR